MALTNIGLSRSLLCLPRQQASGIQAHIRWRAEVVTAQPVGIKSNRASTIIGASNQRVSPLVATIKELVPGITKPLHATVHIQARILNYSANHELIVRVILSPKLPNAK